MKVFGQQSSQFRQIFLTFSEKTFAGSLEFLKSFIVAIIQDFFLEKLPIPLYQIQVVGSSVSILIAPLIFKRCRPQLALSSFSGPFLIQP